jgi:hypothetical protein
MTEHKLELSDSIIITEEVDGANIIVRTGDTAFIRTDYP